MGEVIPGVGVKALVILGLAALLVIFWWLDRSGQYRAGVADTKLAVERAIANSKELVRDEKHNAARAASDAARRVCLDAGYDVFVCSDI